eukprot:345544_1
MRASFDMSYTTSIQRILSAVDNKASHQVHSTSSNNNTNEAKNWSCSKQNWLKQWFLLLWSLGSGYGIVFAIESFFYEYFGFDTRLEIALKGLIAICFGIIIGFMHFILTVDDGSPKIHPLLLKLIAEQQKRSRQWETQLTPFVSPGFGPFIGPHVDQ